MSMVLWLSHFQSSGPIAYECASDNKAHNHGSRWLVPSASDAIQHDNWPSMLTHALDCHWTKIFDHYSPLPAMNHNSNLPDTHRTAHHKCYQCACSISNHSHKYHKYDNDYIRRDGPDDMNDIHIDRCALHHHRNRFVYGRCDRKMCRCRLARFPAIWFLV